MKNLLILLVVLLTMAIRLNAQIYIGPKMGINYSKVPTNETLPEGNKELLKTGLNLGAAANIGFMERVSLQSELLYTQKGYKDQWRRKSDLLLVQESVSANYIELVVMPRYCLGGENVKVFFNAGPSIGYWITGKTEFIKEQDISITKVKIDFDSKAKDQLDEEKRLEFAINAGTGLLLAAGTGNIFVDLRYSYGITPLRIWEDKPGHTAHWNNSVFALTFGYLFKL